MTFAAVARKEKGKPTRVGVVIRAEFGLDDDMVSISGAVVFTPKPFELNSDKKKKAKFNVKEFLCPANTTVEYSGEVALPSLDSYVEDGRAVFNVRGLAYCNPDLETAKVGRVQPLSLLPIKLPKSSIHHAFPWVI